MLRVDRACLDGDEATAFDHSFAPGEMTVVLGGNLSGKTNLCRLLAGLPTQAHGDVSYDEQPWSHLPPQQRSVAVVFQAFVNYPNWTVAQNIASPLIARGLSPRSRNKKSAPWRKPLASVICWSETLMSCPEDSSNDLPLHEPWPNRPTCWCWMSRWLISTTNFERRWLWSLKTLLAETRSTVIYTSSDPRDAFALGDQVLLLERNQKLQSGTPLQVYQNPSNLAAAQLMSDPGVNLLPASQLTERGERRAVRPEHVRLGAETVPQSDAELRFDMQVHSVERSGDETFARQRLRPAESASDGTLGGASLGMHPVDAGQAVALYVRCADILTLAVD